MHLLNINALQTFFSFYILLKISIKRIEVCGQNVTRSGIRYVAMEMMSWAES